MATRQRPKRSVSRQRSRAATLTIGFIGIATAIVLAYVGFNAPNAIPGRSYYNLRAEFNEADNLTGHYQIRIRGRLVGQVLKPRASGDKAVADLQLESGLAPLLSDTTLRVRPRSAIGVRFVDLEPGTQGEPLQDGDTIPATQTSSTTQLDTVLDTLDPATRDRTASLLSGLGGGLAGRGEDLNETFRTAGGFLTDTRRVMRTIADVPRGVQTFVDGAEGAATAADPVRDVIATGFAPEADAAAAFSRSRSEVDALLDTAPAALPAVRTGLARSTPVVQESGRLARALLPLLQAAPVSLRETSALMAEARPATRRISDTLGVAQRAVDPTLNLLRTVDPVLPGLRTGLRLPAPILRELAPRRCDVVQMLRNWESMFAWGQNDGPYLRFNIIATPESVTGLGVPNTVDANPYPEPCEKLKEGPR